MAVAVLSPWPAATASVALGAARRCLSDALGTPVDGTVDRLGSTAAALVERYAPSAPQPVKNECVIRAAGWLAEQPAPSIRSESVGDIETHFAPSMTGVLLHSGAKSMLYPWRAKTAGVSR